MGFGNANELSKLEKQLQLLYEQLEAIEQEALLAEDPMRTVQCKQRIRKEIAPEIAAKERTYWEALGQWAQGPVVVAVAIALTGCGIIPNTNDAQMLNNRGSAYAAKGENDRAIADFNQAIALNSKNADTFLKRGSAYAAKGENDRAINDFNQAIALNPKDVAALVARGLAYASKGETDRTINDFSQAITLNSKDYGYIYIAFISRGIAYAAKGETDRAIDDFNQAIVRNPQNALGFVNRGHAYAVKGETDGSMSY